MVTSLVLASLLTAAPGAPTLADSGHFRLVSDDERTAYDNGPHLLVTPIIFLSVGAAGTLTGAVLLYAGALSAFAGSGVGMAGTVAVGAGLALLTLGIVVVVVAVVFAVIGAIKLVRAIRGPQAQPRERFDAARPPPAPVMPEGLVVARF